VRLYPSLAGAIVCLGVLIYAVIRAVNSRLETQLASRYLMRLKSRSVAIHLITLVLVVVAGSGQLLIWRLSAHKPLFAPPTLLQAILPWVVLGAMVATVLIGFLVLLLRHFTIFTAISTYGLFIGSAALVVVLSVMSGFEQDLKHKILGSNAHIQITTPDREFTDYREAGEKIRAIVGDKMTPYISNEVMVSSQSNLSGVVLKGIDPATAALATDLKANIDNKEGGGSLDNLIHPEKLQGIVGASPLDYGDEEDEEIKPGKAAPPSVDAHGNRVIGAEPPNPTRRILPGLIVGKELAKNLRLYVGDDVNVVSPMGDIGPAGPMPKSRAFRVAAIFYSGMYEYDTKYVYMTIPDAQKFLGLDDEITGYEVAVADPDETEPTVAKLKAALAGQRGVDVQDWKELNRNLFSALQVEKVAMFIVLCFIILVAGFSIIANGIMLVREKRREIAILKSMGATDGTVLKTFFYIGVYMGALGIAAGILTGIGTCLLLGRFGISLDTDVYYISKLPVQMNYREIVAVFGAAMGIVLVATLYPALVAARLRPVDGLRYDQS
jgi:lipoprotein-releasing system permease protein